MSEKENLIKKTYFTVLYLNCLNHPPSTFEVWRHFIDFSQQIKKASFGEVVNFLNDLKRENKIYKKKGFWIIKGHDESAGQRIINQKNSLVKLRKIKKRVNRFKRLPFLRGVFVAGTLSFQTASKESDWDILVIMKKDRIWLGRLILTGFLFLTGQKRQGLKITDRFCLNHFLTEQNLIPENRNEYTACEYGFVFPIIGKELFKDFMRLNWTWMRNYTPNFEVAENYEGGFLLKDVSRPGLIEKLMEFFGVAGFLNKQCKSWMVERIEKNPETFKEGGVVIYNDGELAFWPDFKNLNKIVKL